MTKKNNTTDAILAEMRSRKGVVSANVAGSASTLTCDFANDGVTPKPAKYRNQKTLLVIDGKEVVFDSKKEARRYLELRAMQATGAISDLERQVKIMLVVNSVIVTRWTADHRYREDGKVIIEEVKSEATRKERSYRMMRRLFDALNPDQVVHEV